MGKHCHTVAKEFRHEKKDWNSRSTLLSFSTRLLCPECREVKFVTDFQPMSKQVKLECGHLRPVMTLPGNGFKLPETIADEIRQRAERELEKMETERLRLEIGVGVDGYID